VAIQAVMVAAERVGVECPASAEAGRCSEPEWRALSQENTVPPVRPDSGLSGSYERSVGYP
jgi:hypothetical protein